MRNIGNHRSLLNVASISALICALILAVTPPAFSQNPTPPVLVTTSGLDGSTLGIPRWKGYMSEVDPRDFWISYGSTGTSSGSLNYTTDGGSTWSSQVIQIDNTGWLDFHLSLFGLNGELYFTWPGATSINFRKFNSPAQGNGDRGPLVSISGTSSAHRSNIMVQSSGRIWVFTRRGSYPSENVLYHYSDNGGTSWTSGVAFATGANDVRIGSMPYMGGNPALVVLYMDDSRGYEYYIWNGSSFESKADHSIYAGNMGQVRSFTHNVVRDTTFHLVFGLGNDLYHVWKHYANGTGSWQVSVIDSSPYTVDVDWFPTSVVRGDDMYIFYCRKSSSSFASSMIYYKKWSQVSESWTSAVLVSTDPNNVGNRDPNSCFQVPESADYIPVFWNSTTGSYGIYFSKIIVPVGVTRQDIDLKILDFRNGNASLQEVLDLISQYNNGG